MFTKKMFNKQVNAKNPFYFEQAEREWSLGLLKKKTSCLWRTLFTFFATGSIQKRNSYRIERSKPKNCRKKGRIRIRKLVRLGKFVRPRRYRKPGRNPKNIMPKDWTKSVCEYKKYPLYPEIQLHPTITDAKVSKIC